MGQYFVIADMDAQEYIDPYDLDDGCKLMEFAYSRASTNFALLNKLVSDWNGDKVLVIGDYAQADNEEDNYYNTLKTLEKDFRTDNLYEYIEDNFQNVSSSCDISDHYYRYIYNLETLQYIDLYKCPVEWAYYDSGRGIASVSSISPMILLITAGNDRGLGDFHEGHNGYEYVGSWCNSSEKILVKQDIQDIIGGFNEFNPDFTENKEVIPYTQKTEMIQKAILKETA